MPVEQFITCMFCLIDGLYISLVTRSLRKRGTPPKLSNSEAIAIEITGEWLGFHSDKDIWKYFKQHWSHLFPKLPDRSQFVGQTVNLWVVKQQMHQHLVKLSGADTADIHNRCLCNDTSCLPHLISSEPEPQAGSQMLSPRCGSKMIASKSDTSGGV